MAKVNFKITSQRVAEACGVVEYINLTLKDKATVIAVAPRFVVDENGEYSMTVKYDEDGNIEAFEGHIETLMAMSQVTPKRLEKLTNEFSEAARGVVNPQKGGG